jgi:hypothetical protein
VFDVPDDLFSCKYETHEAFAIFGVYKCSVMERAIDVELFYFTRSLYKVHHINAYSGRSVYLSLNVSFFTNTLRSSIKTGVIVLH